MFNTSILTMKKATAIIMSLILTFSFIFCGIGTVHADSKSELDKLKSEFIALMDYDTGNILYQKNGNKKLYPASTTKVWTAFCALKKCKNVNEVITIKDMPQIEGSCMYLENGEKFTVKELLESLLIHSSNDVAYVIAKHFGNGNVKNFIDFMNKEAKEYGALNTHFNNPSGLPDEDHYSTAIDMTNLARVAYSNPLIQKIVAMKSISFKANNVYKYERVLYNTNKFLNSKDLIDYKGKKVEIKYPIVDGIKTGFTDDAGNCLLSTASKNGFRLIAGVFRAPGGSLYHDSRAVLDYGFDNYKLETFIKRKKINGEKNLRFSIPDKVKYSYATDFSVLIPNKDKFNPEDVHITYDFSRLKMPVKKGDIIGVANIAYKGNTISCVALVAQSESQTYFSFLMNKLGLSKNKDIKNQNSKNSAADKGTASKNSTENKDSHNSGKKTKPEKTENKSIPEKIKLFFTDSMSGLTGMFANVKEIKNFEKTEFYKYLDSNIQKHIGFIPSKVVIFGVPALVLLIILILIISMIKDKIRNSKKNRENDPEESEAEEKAPDKNEIIQQELKDKYNVREKDTEIPETEKSSENKKLEDTAEFYMPKSDNDRKNI